MSDRHNISLNVNGADYSCEIDARMTLADCLREKLDLRLVESIEDALDAALAAA